MDKINIFDIQRGSLVDGPGIRTTVFFKGCNLKCQWCHNPESQLLQPQLMIHQNKCTHCGKCEEVCPNHLKTCTLCGSCALYCPNDSREVCGRKIEAEQLLEEILKDKTYYEASGGGVTFSGGECMLQIDALEEMLALCKENGIATAVDTAGYVPWSYFERILPYTDLFLYDIKCWDERKHTEYTGVSNKRILDNLGRLAALDPERIIIRVPVIPGVNTSPEEMEGIAGFLKDNKITKVELLPYHKMGEHKYSDLGLEFEKFEVPSEEMMECFRKYIK